MTRAVEFLPAASRQVNEAENWWRANRPSAPDLFKDEIAQALVQLAQMPLAGRRVRSTRGAWRDVRVLLLARTEYLLFYRLVGEDVVQVVALRHGRRKPV